jgi:hypothetical protein
MEEETIEVIIQVTNRMSPTQSSLGQAITDYDSAHQKCSGVGAEFGADSMSVSSSWCRPPFGAHDQILNFI